MVAHITGTFEQFVNQLQVTSASVLFFKIKVQMARALASFLYLLLCYRATSFIC